MERNELQVFENETFGEIRMVLIDNEPCLLQLMCVKF